MRCALPSIAAILFTWAVAAQDRHVDPTWLHRYVPQVEEKAAEVTTPTCHYKPIFGVGDAQSSVPRGIARFGEITLDAGGTCQPVSYAAEEQVYVVLEGAGAADYSGTPVPMRENDFMYLPPGIRHSIAAAPGSRIRVVVMGFKIPDGMHAVPPPKPLVANMDQVKWQTVSGHPDSVLYQLLMGDTKSTRDKIAAGRVLTSLFVMQFEPGGTNFPHHHEQEEEIYLVLDGDGDMVAGGGMDGVEGRHPARVGDAYFFRLNTTVGFYSTKGTARKARILAVRSLYPFSKNP
jgi:mannose-6-phosphate isomerase-like protein (cupin superfamily)